jgi:hypothetical protein
MVFAEKGRDLQFPNSSLKNRLGSSGFPRRTEQQGILRKDPVRSLRTEQCARYYISAERETAVYPLSAHDPIPY